MDEEYIDKILAGNVETFRYFIHKYKNMVYSIALSIVKDQMIAEEVTQDAFINAFNALKSFRRESKFSTWIYTIVYNEAFKRLKKTKTQIQTSHENISLDIEDESILSSIQQEEQRIVINEALEMLPINESLALKLYYLEEESINEVAKITGWSKSKVKVTLFRARKSMYTVIKSIINRK
jgi:RNA polymerase sigma factor (sigma-70 family)